jgi:hypothetical protein
MAVRVAFDWKGLEAAAVAHVVSAVRQVREAHPSETLYGAMFHAFYGDGEVLYWPSMTIGTEESLASAVAAYNARRAEGGKPDEGDHGMRWSGPDLHHLFPPMEEQDGWEARCAEAAKARKTFREWEKVYDRFLRCFPRAAKQARAQLIREGLVGKDFIAVATDEDGDLVPLSLTKAQLLKHFPQYDRAERERARLAALPLAERIAEVAPQAVHAAPFGPLIGEYEDLLRALGEAAVPALLEVVAGRSPGQGFLAIMLLAEINHAAPEVVAALEAAMTNPEFDGSTRAWAATALARLDRMDLISRHMPSLPDGVAARGLAGPYRSFRDRGKHRPLDYRPLEEVLDLHPDIAPAVAEELKPGRGYCTIEADEVAGARYGAESRWEFIRQHARSVLEAFEEDR